MIVDSSAQCNDLNFQIGSTSSGISRRWSIKITQISCDSELLAPDGCTQYFLGSTGTVQTFNFDGGLHLANQNQAICVRAERGNCRICWSAQQQTDFAVSGVTMAVGTITVNELGHNGQESCCRYGLAGTKTRGYDCVVIPGAVNFPGPTLEPSRICGRNEGLVRDKTSGEAFTPTATLCSTKKPFMIRFQSDNFEFTATKTVLGVTANREAVTAMDIGFKLSFFQDNVMCFTPS